MAAEKKRGLFSVFRRKKDIKEMKPPPVVIAGDNKLADGDHWKKSYVPVVSASIGNGSNLPSSAAKSRPLPSTPAASVPNNISTSPIITQPVVSAPERKKRQAPKPPSEQLDTSVELGSPNGSVSSAGVDSCTHVSAPPTKCSNSSDNTDSRTTTISGVSADHVAVKLQHTKRPAPSAPHSKPLPTAPNASSAQEVGQHCGQKSISTVGENDEVLQNMKLVELVPPEHPEPMDKGSAIEPADKLELTIPPPKNFCDFETVEMVSLDSTETETATADCQNRTSNMTALAGGSDGEQCLQSAQQIGQNSIELAADKSSTETGGQVADTGQDTVHMTKVMLAESSNSERQVENNKDSVDKGWDKATLPESLQSLTFPDGNPQFTEAFSQPTAHSGVKCSVHAVPNSSERNHSATLGSAGTTSEDENYYAVETSSTKLGEVTHDSTARVNSPEDLSLEQLLSFKISVKDVKEKRGELASASQIPFDTAWQSSGDGGRFRIRSMAKNVSCTEVFGPDTEMRSSKEGKEANGSFKSEAAGNEADSKPVTDMVAKVRDSECLKTEEQKPSAFDEHTDFIDVASDNMINFQHQQTNHETTLGESHSEVKAEEVGRDDEKHRFRKNELPDRVSADVCECQGNISELAVADEGGRDMPSSSKYLSHVGSDSNKLKIRRGFAAVSDAANRETDTTDGKVNNRIITTVPQSRVTEKLDDIQACSLAPGFSSLHGTYRGKPIRQAETITIDKSHLSAIGGLNSRVYRANCPTGEAKPPAQAARNSSDIPRKNVEELARREPVISTVSSSNMPAIPVEPVGLHTAVQKRPKSTVIRIVNGCFVQSPASEHAKSLSASYKVPPPTAPRMVGKGNLAVGQASDDRISPQLRTVSSIQPSGTIPVSEQSTIPAKQFDNSKIGHTSGTGDIDSNTHMKDHSEKQEMLIPKWIKATSSKTVPQTISQISVHSDLPFPEPQLQAASFTSSETVHNFTQPAVDQKEIPQQTSDMVSSLHNSSLVMANNTEVVTSTADSGIEEPNHILAQARSMLRHMSKPETSEVAISNNDSSTSKFILRSASSTMRTACSGADAEDRSLADHEPAQAGVGLNPTGNVLTANGPHGRTFKFMSPVSFGASSTLPPTFRNTTSTSIGNTSKSHAVSGFNSCEVDMVKSFGIQPELHTESKTAKILDPRSIEVEKPKTPSFRFAVASSQNSSKMTTADSKSNTDFGTKLAAASLAALHPAKLRPTRSKPLPPPKLTLHEQLMIAIRNAGGMVGKGESIVSCEQATSNGKNSSQFRTVGSGAKTTDNVVTSTNNLAIPVSVANSGSSIEPSGTVTVDELSATAEASRSKSVNPSSSIETATSQSTSDEARSSSHGPATGAGSEVCLVSSSTVFAGKRTRRIIEPPKPTPHEQLMAAIRNAGIL